MYHPLVYRTCVSCTELTVLLLVGGLLVCGALWGAAAGVVATHWLLQLLCGWVLQGVLPQGHLLGLPQVLRVGSFAAAHLALQVLVRVVGSVAALQLTGLLMCVARNCLLKVGWARGCLLLQVWAFTTFVLAAYLAGIHVCLHTVSS